MSRRKKLGKKWTRTIGWKEVDEKKFDKKKRRKISIRGEKE